MGTIESFDKEKDLLENYKNINYVHLSLVFLNNFLYKVIEPL